MLKMEDRILVFAGVIILPFAVTIVGALTVVPKFESYECYSCGWNTYSKDGDVVPVILPGEVATITVQSLCADPFQHKRKTLAGDYVKFEGFLPARKCPTSMCQKVKVKTRDRGNYVVRDCLPKGSTCLKDKIIRRHNATYKVTCCDGHMCNSAERLGINIGIILASAVLVLFGISA